MLLPLALSVFACSEFDYTEELAATNPLPEIDADCNSAIDDLFLDDGSFLVTRIAPDGEVCRASVYVQSALVEWSDVEEGLGDRAPFGRLDVEWLAVSASFQTLAVTLPSGEFAPAGTTISVGQLLVGEETRDQLAENAVALFDDDLADRPEFLIGFDHVLGDGETDLAKAVTPVRGRPLAAVDASWNDDAEMSLVTVASVAVPFDTLAELGSAELALDVDESVTLSGKIGFRFGGGD